MQHAVLPDQISSADFSTYTENWRRLVDGANVDDLKAYFTSNGTLLNYVYLLQSQVDSLVPDGINNVCAKFALVPHGGALVFSMIFFSDNDGDVPISGYHLCGVAGTAAIDDSSAGVAQEEGADLLVPITFEEARTGILLWNVLAAEGLNSSWFKTKCGTGYKLLRGYTHEAQDFRDAKKRLTDGALWLNFSLHLEREVANPKVIFDAVLARNNEPAAGKPGTITLSRTLLYYDVAHPCPPACGIIDRV